MLKLKSSNKNSVGFSETTSAASGRKYKASSWLGGNSPTIEKFGSSVWDRQLRLPATDGAGDNQSCQRSFAKFTLPGEGPN